jgi:hypothetical protein
LGGRHARPVPLSGVGIAYPALDNRATNTPVTIKTSHGRKTVHVNQQVKPPIDDLLLPLGTFDLKAGETVGARIRNADTDGYAAVDALQLVPVDEKQP